jgi:hypothetical protein
MLSDDEFESRHDDLLRRERAAFDDYCSPRPQISRGLNTAEGSRSLTDNKATWESLKAERKALIAQRLR